MICIAPAFYGIAQVIQPPLVRFHQQQQTSRLSMGMSFHSEYQALLSRRMVTSVVSLGIKLELFATEPP